MGFKDRRSFRVHVAATDLRGSGRSSGRRKALLETLGRRKAAGSGCKVERAGATSYGGEVVLGASLARCEGCMVQIVGFRSRYVTKTWVEWPACHPNLLPLAGDSCGAELQYVQFIS